MTFEPLPKDEETLDYYVKTFQESSLRKILYATTPKTKKEISGWLTEITSRPNVTYFTIRENGSIIGHVGLDDPDYVSRSIRLGCFLGRPKLWPKYGKEIFEFIIQKAQELNWKFVFCDVAGAESAQITALEGLKFKRNINKPSLLTRTLLT